MSIQHGRKTLTYILIGVVCAIFPEWLKSMHDGKDAIDLVFPTSTDKTDAYSIDPFVTARDYYERELKKEISGLEIHEEQLAQQLNKTELEVDQLQDEMKQQELSYKKRFMRCVTSPKRSRRQNILKASNKENKACASRPPQKVTNSWKQEIDSLKQQIDSLKQELDFISNKLSDNYNELTNVQLKLNTTRKIDLSLRFSTIVYNETYNDAKFGHFYIDELSPYHPRVLFISFMGTNDLRDIQSDLTFYRSVKFGGYVHNGFYNRAMEIMNGTNSIVSWINEFRNQSFNHIVFTGHSLGGAVAQIFASVVYEYCSYNDCPFSSEVIDFGAPLVAQKQCHMHPNITHVINNNDIVPRLLRDFEILFGGSYFFNTFYQHFLHFVGLVLFVGFLFKQQPVQMNENASFFAFIAWLLLIYYLANDYASVQSWFQMVDVLPPDFYKPMYFLNCCGVGVLLFRKRYVFVAIIIAYCHDNNTLQNFLRNDYYPPKPLFYHLCMINILIMSRKIKNLNNGWFVLHVLTPLNQYLSGVIRLFSFLIRISLIIFICFFVRDVFYPQYHPHGTIVHLRLNSCSVWHGEEFYGRVRYGMDDSFISDHSITEYTKNWKQFGGATKCQMGDKTWNQSAIPWTELFVGCIIAAMIIFMCDFIVRQL